MRITVTLSSRPSGLVKISEDLCSSTLPPIDLVRPQKGESSLVAGASTVTWPGCLDYLDRAKSLAGQLEIVHVKDSPKSPEELFDTFGT